MRQSTISASLPVQWGYTPFLRAAQQGHAEVARFLLQSGSVFYEKNSVSAVYKACAGACPFPIVDGCDTLFLSIKSEEQFVCDKIVSSDSHTESIEAVVLILCLPSYTLSSPSLRHWPTTHIQNICMH